MARKKSSEKELQWRDMLRRQAKSGLSIRRFCAQEGISQPSFYAWRRRLRDSPSSVKRPRTASRQGNTTGGSGEFIPVKLLDSAHRWEVIHPQGYRVRVKGEVNAVTLRCVLDVLQERGQG